MHAASKPNMQRLVGGAWFPYKLPCGRAPWGSCRRTGFSTRAHVHCRALSQEQIAERIAAAQQRKRSRLTFHCPACSAPLHSGFLRHLQACCPDLLQGGDAWHEALAADQAPAFPDLQPLLAAAAKEEAARRERALDITFRSGEHDANGQRIRHSPEEVGRRMGLPTCRAARLVSRAMRAVPLVADRDAALPVLWEDEYFIAVDKPEGMQTAPVHRYKGGSVVNALIGQLGGRPPHVLHRLDMDTSGVLLMAKQPGVVAAVHRQFRRREVGKLYLALCVGQGQPPGTCYHADQPIGRHPEEDNARQLQPGGQQAHTTCLLLSCSQGQGVREMLRQGRRAPFFASQAAPHLHSVSLAAASPHSGRTHQIRLHLAAHGHPLLGDDLYGLQGPWIARQALHAARLEFKHPVTGQQVAVHAPLPKDICSAATAFGLQDELLAPAPEVASRLAWVQPDLQAGCNDLHSEQQPQHQRMMQVQLLDQAWYRVAQESKPCHDRQ